ESALRRFDRLARNLARAVLMRLEFHQAGGHNLGQVALLVALGNFDGFIDLALAQRASNSGSEGARLDARGVEGHPAVNHHADRPARHDEENEGYELCQNSHLMTHGNQVPTGTAFLQKPSGE